ncbi:MAG: TauD/TfdA family dioxygenase [Candidatus Rokuibacteriota bacterium]
MPGDATAVPIPAGDVERDKAWSGDSLSPQAWLIPFPDPGIAELDEIAAFVRATSPPLETLTPPAFSLEACARVMAHVRARLQHQIGLAVVDRIPVERYSPRENRAIGWLLAAMLGQVVAQKWNGTRLYDVKDSGQPLGYGVRRSVTNLGQPFHTDGGWLWMPPAFVGLFCLQSAREGGISRFVSLVRAHNEMRRRHPDLLARLYRPFPWDRQAEHGPDEERFCRHPVYHYDGRTLTARYYEDYILSGCALAGETLDDEGREALAAMRAIVDDPGNWVEFRIESGQLQYLNNRQFAHSRTAFADAAAGPPRHMLRLWNRDEGTVDLDGQGGRRCRE